MTIEQVVTLVQTVGIPTAILFSILYGLYRLGREAISKIGIPLAAKAIEHLDTSMACMTRMATQLDAIKSTMDIHFASPNEVVSQNQPPEEQA